MKIWTKMHFDHTVNQPGICDGVRQFLKCHDIVHKELFSSLHNKFRKFLLLTWNQLDQCSPNGSGFSKQENGCMNSATIMLRGS